MELPLKTNMLELINFNALPMFPLDDDLAISNRERERQHEAMKAYVKQNPPSCFVGSLDKLNTKIAQIDLKRRLKMSSNLLAIDHLEAEKKLKEQQRILGEKEKSSKGKKKLQKFLPPTQSTSNVPHTGSKKRTQKDGLAELYRAPEYQDALPNVLPNRVNYCDMVGNVIRAQGNPVIGKVFCASSELKWFFASPYSKAIVLDCFWWIFHERYDQNKEIQKKLFDRVSKNYAHLLLTMSNSEHKEIILKRLPSLLSQALYTSFCTCFPQSWFNSNEFKSFICNTMHQWIGGTLPDPKSYVNWNYFELDPVRFRREELMRDKEFSGSSSKPTARVSKMEAGSKGQRQNSRKVLEMTRKVKVAAQKESHPACKGPEFSKNLFSVTGNSPLIIHYLRQNNAYRQAGQDILMVRHDMTNTMPEGTSTYRDVIQQVKTNIIKLNKDTKYLRKIHYREWRVFDQKQKDLQTEFIRVTEKLTSMGDTRQVAMPSRGESLSRFSRTER
ncbi:protein FAM227A isoform X1 [Macrotis lagotis]|uniref:protein FAM227A isoform X1 n=1 Tax=Macrotis lagotis TaxID=92651 RepID=UPI003D6973D7